MNVNGRLGADAIQRMQQAQQTNAPQVENQNEETSQTVRKPLSKSEVAGMMKGKVGEPTNNVNTGIVTTQEAQAADNEENEEPKFNKQWSNSTDLSRHGKKGDFCIYGVIHLGKLEYRLNYIDSAGKLQWKQISATDFAALSGYDGTIIG